METCRRAQRDGEAVSRYIVKIIGPAGMETYLARGREVGEQYQATRYPHPSNARQAADAYREKCEKHYAVPPFVGVLDSRDWERGWL